MIPGLVALVVIPGLGSDKPNMEYNNAIPLLMNEYLPNGMLGLALAGLIASGYSNIMDYIQLLFSFFNAPLFATFIIGMFWKRMTPWAGFWGLVAGTAGAAVAHYGNKWGWFDLGSAQAAAFWGAVAAFVADAIVTVAVSIFTRPKPIEELQGLVYGMANGRRTRPPRSGPGTASRGCSARVPSRSSSS